MSNFKCEKCGAICSDTEKGYVTGCEHYPADVENNKPVFCLKKTNAPWWEWLLARCFGKKKSSCDLPFYGDPGVIIRYYDFRGKMYIYDFEFIESL